MSSDQSSTPSQPRPDERRRQHSQAHADERRLLRQATVAIGCLGLGLACAAFEVAYTVNIVPWLIPSDSGAYSLPADIWNSLQPARWVANGALLYVFEAEGQRGAYGVLWPTVLAPAVALGDHLELVDSGRFPLPRPTMAIPMIVAAVTAAITALAAAIWRITASLAVKARVLTIAAAVGPALIAAGSWFHGEDILVVAFVLLAATSPVTAGWWTAAALLTKPTMLAYAPALLAACEPSRRRSFMMIAAGVPAVMLSLIFAAAPLSLFSGFTDTLTCAYCFRPALWASLFWDDPTQISATYGRVAWIAAGTATAWLWRHRCRDPQGLLTVLTAIALMRCLVFEAGIYAYYWVPAILFTLVLTTRDDRSLWVPLLGFAGLTAWHSASVDMPLPLWWAVAIAATAIVWYPVPRSLGRPRLALSSSREQR